MIPLLKYGKLTRFTDRQRDIQRRAFYFHCEHARVRVGAPLRWRTYRSTAMHNPLPLLFHCPPLHALSIRIAILATRRHERIIPERGTRDDSRRNYWRLIDDRNSSTWSLPRRSAHPPYMSRFDRLIAIN